MLVSFLCRRRRHSSFIKMGPRCRDSPDMTVRGKGGGGGDQQEGGELIDWFVVWPIKILL